MKDREKQIEEMAHTICSMASKPENCRECDGRKGGCFTLPKMEMLYDAGYQKADKSTEQLLQEIESLKKEIETQRFANKQLLKKHKQDREELWKRCRIETAREFAEKLKKEAVAVDYGCGAGSFEDVAIEDIDDVLEEFEKEVEVLND